MKHQSLRTKLLIFIVVVMMTLIMLGAYIYYQYETTLNDADSVRQQSAQRLSLAHGVIHSFHRQSLAWDNLLLRGHKPDLYNPNLREFYRVERETYTLTESLADLLSRSNKYPVDISHIISKLKGLRGHYRNSLEIYNLSEEPYFDTDHFLSPFTEDIDRELQQLIHQIEVLEKETLSALSKAIDNQKNVFLLAILVFLVIAFMAFLWFFDLNIMKPIAAAISTAKRIADGDIHSRIKNEATHEFAVFSVAFNHMIDNLERINQQLERKINQLQDEVNLRKVADRKIQAQKQVLLASRKVIELAHQEAVSANQAKSEFLSRMSHELRTPLNAMLGFAQLLSMDELTPDQKDSTNEILTAGQHLLNLIDEVLNLSKIETGIIDVSIESFDIGILVKETLSLVKPLAENRGTQMDLDIESFDGLQAKGDKTRCKEIMLNLLSNAIKYAHTNGKVWVYCESKQDILEIFVCDNGPGIPKELQHEMFQPFNRLRAKNSNVEGTGLGLVISKYLANAMGGDISFECEPDKKTCFSFDLPRALLQTK